MNLHLILTAGMLTIACAVIIIRLRSARKPTNTKKIIMPPVGMSTGFLMFVYPPCRIPFTWGLVAFIAGTLLFALPLIRTSRFYVTDGQVYLKRSKAFVWILFTLLIIRISAHEYLEQFITLEQTAGVFFVLAFGMLLPWRLAMYMQYKKLKDQIKTTAVD
ncbi:MAG: cytochrome c biogenesis protein CcdC [Firmicutes bacterium]|uniref:Membrane protein CcdC involved in cytochrome C biogenesis n=1 Tax=Melghirimyces thermohalophilus TaxID=1236220 RepID=A0A1G6P2U1_9BACL|nr:cytochrome c biogenesis protein CcdC [Melghirimyces thermohalophilus]MDA8351865.1 cytochrome c biogenesis protein CcdC [Bacillota bacterium]SDC73747.1 Membrane protein CcdC involved in cytochrome C biogenesis [Melghirimyces thermohalophilus]